jgi:hypothetical protein
LVLTGQWMFVRRPGGWDRPLSCCGAGGARSGARPPHERRGASRARGMSERAIGGPAAHPRRRSPGPRLLHGVMAMAAGTNHALHWGRGSLVSSHGRASPRDASDLCIPYAGPSYGGRGGLRVRTDCRRGRCGVAPTAFVNCAWPTGLVERALHSRWGRTDRWARRDFSAGQPRLATDGADPSRRSARHRCQA